MNDRQREFLIKLDADKTRHSGRTLFDHLKGVHDLLRDWDNEYHVCLAGLFHSIYGTSTFKHQSLQDRGALVEMIGVPAELLVHLFATADRPLFTSVQDKETRQKLMEIEAANLLEQGAVAPSSLRRLSRMKLSNGAKAALSGEVV
jgi:hypothetical protein